MKKLLLTGIAVLSLASCQSPARFAHAETPDEPVKPPIFDCEKIVDRYYPQEDVGNAVTVTHDHVSDMEIYTIEVTAFHHRKKGKLIVTFDAEKEKLTVNGKNCKRKKE
jgi:hypothetical protein